MSTDLQGRGLVSRQKASFRIGQGRTDVCARPRASRARGRGGAGAGGAPGRNGSEALHMAHVVAFDASRRAREPEQPLRTARIRPVETPVRLAGSTTR